MNVRRVFRLFTQPMQLFPELVRSPDVAAPVLIILGTQAFLTWALMPYLSATLQDQLRTVGLSVPGPPHPIWWIVGLIAFASTALISLITLFLNALILTGTGRVSGMVLPLPVSASFLAYSQLPQVLRSIAYGVYALATRSLPRPVSVGVLLPETASVFRDVLWNVDAFTLWSYVLLGLALATVAGRARWRMWVPFASLLIVNALSGFLIPASQANLPVGMR